MAKSVEELLVFQRALDAAAAIAAILKRGSFDRDFRLRDQLASASERVPSAIAEGFEQSTDKHFAQYLYRAKGSSREVRTQLVIAGQRELIGDIERIAIATRYEEIARMLTGLIHHLERENRRHRG